MVRQGKARDLDKIDALANAVKNDKDRIGELCREFETINPKSHKSKFGA